MKITNSEKIYAGIAGAFLVGRFSANITGVVTGALTVAALVAMTFLVTWWIDQ